jgi:hypothetical protein
VRFLNAHISDTFLLILFLYACIDSKRAFSRDHPGRTMTSKMPQVHFDYFGTESSKSHFEARDIVKEKTKQKSARQAMP